MFDVTLVKLKIKLWSLNEENENKFMTHVLKSQK